MKRLIYLVLPVLTFTACSVDNTDLESIDAINEVNAVYNVPGCTSTIWPYVNGGVTYGNIEATNDENFLYVTFVATQGVLTEARLQVARSISEFALNSGDNIQMNNIPKYKINNANDKTIKFPLVDLGITETAGQELFILSRATISGESSWAGDKTVGKNEKGYYFSYIIQTCEKDEPIVAKCEGTYMKGDTPFTSIEGWNENNWGWAHEFKASKDANELFELYAGAAQNDLNKGNLMGTVKITWTSTGAETGTVQFTFNPIDGYKMGEIKAFVGDILPEKHAPGQYGNNREDNDGNFWVIIKADVCEE